MLSLLDFSLLFSVLYLSPLFPLFFSSLLFFRLAGQVEPAQLTADLDGLLFYNHERWIHFRLLYEDFIGKSIDLLTKFGLLKEELTNNDFPDDLEGAQKMIETHGRLKIKVAKAPLGAIDAAGRELLRTLQPYNADVVDDAGAVVVVSSGAGAATLPPPLGGADLATSINQVRSFLDQIRATHEHLQHLWHLKKMRLDQCFQLRSFEAETDNMLEWIERNKDAFLVNYTQIGDSFLGASNLQGDHSRFAMNAMNVYVTIARLVQMADRLVDAGHYAAQQIRQIGDRLECEWRVFATALDDRSTVLTLSVMFHQKAEHYLERVPEWRVACMDASIPDNVGQLEEAIHHHQALYDAAAQTYNNVCVDGKTLLDALQQPVAPNRNNALTANADYTAGAKHVIDVIHEILSSHRQIDQYWHNKKVRLHQRLGLRLFQQDVKQVLDWLDNHGEMFLRKNTSVGRTLAKARLLRKSHQHFEAVLQVSGISFTLQQVCMQAARCDKEDRCNISVRLWVIDGEIHDPRSCRVATSEPRFYQ